MINDGISYLKNNYCRITEQEVIHKDNLDKIIYNIVVGVDIVCDEIKTFQDIYIYPYQK